MTDRELDNISGQLPQAEASSQPPLHLWHPALSGAIDIRIDRDGRWFHQGELIRREALVRLFASILRREEDGHYYLVTPVEKWRVAVEELPLLVVDVRFADEALAVQINTGRRFTVGPEHPLFLHPVRDSSPVAAVGLAYGLSALFSRACWYRLAERTVEVDGRPGIYSAGEFYILG